MAYQIPYTVEVTNRFKGLDVIDKCLKNYGRRFMTLYKRQYKARPKGKKKIQKAKWLSEEALQIAEKRREAKAQEKRKDIPI